MVELLNAKSQLMSMVEGGMLCTYLNELLIVYIGDNVTFLVDLSRMGLVGSLHFSLQLVIGVIYGSFVVDEGFDLVNALGHLLIFPHYLLAPHEPQFMLLQLAGGDEVGQVGGVEGLDEFGC